jgi:CheY-like chemotaxis protein
MRADSTPSMPPLQPERRTAFASSAPTSQQELLILEPEMMAVEHAAVLRRDYRVSTTTDGGVALEYLNRSTIALVILDIDSHGTAGIEVCVTARSLRPPATVLITTAKTAGVPDMLVAGCDAVLMKPFAANLLYARIGRLMRTRNEQGATHAQHNGDGDGAAPLAASTNRTWPETACPACSHLGAVSFEFSSYRRSWYACLACKNVWIAKRQE